MSRSNTTTPKHLGLIIDGNRRWAKDNHLTTNKGHYKGYINLKNIVDKAFDRGINYVSAFVFSTENWNRSKEEVGYLMELTLKLLTKDLKEFHNKNIKVVWLGSEQNLSKNILKALKSMTEKTKNNTRGTLALCFNYGGKNEIIEAIKKIVKAEYRPEDINENIVSSNLYVPDLPPLDLMIRTSGEYRISNFMLWRIAYSELIFVDKYWPDFNDNDLEKVIREYSTRKRRFGG